MKKVFILLAFLSFALHVKSTTHTVHVWDGYFQFLPNTITIDLGDTIQWLPLPGTGAPMMVHTITSDTIPAGAAGFDYTWQSPADTFFRYVPTVAGIYEYVCTPHESYNMVGTFTVVDPSVFVAESATLQPIQIFPNPAKSKIHLNGLNARSQSYTIHSLTGQRVDSGTILNEVDVSHLVRGTYIIELLGEKPKRIKFQKL